VSTSSDRPQGGLGLGLAVVKQLVKAHDGVVSVHSQGLGQGSEFIVTLPRLRETFSASAASATGTPSTSGRRLLVVDDNADLALTTAMLLRRKQYEVHTRLSGAEAVEAVQELWPDVVLLDLGMPGMDGYETARRLRTLDWGRQGVIIALSGYGQAEDRKRTREAGFDGHVVKPVNWNELIDLLTNLRVREE
jgi:CheY-like chemotaxis protein